MVVDRQQQRGRVVGRYVIHDEIASGGMASVYFGRLHGPAGFSRTVAIKRLHTEFAKDPEFLAMLLDEARLAARIRHPNVVSTLDVVFEGEELFLVMDYVDGESLSRIRRAFPEVDVPIPVVSAILTGVLQGLHAAHEATSERGEPLGIVHRDVSPQNILVGADGVPRVADFGVAKATGRTASTRDGQVKGKAGYMAPEQLRGGPIDRRVDVYASAIVLWELLTSRRLFLGDSPAQTMLLALEQSVDPPGKLVRGVPPELDALVMRGLSRDPERRFATAMDMAAALEGAVRPATAREVAAWLEHLAGDVLRKRAQLVADIESGQSTVLPRQGESVEREPRPVAQAEANASQVSSISVATPQASPRAPQRSLRGWVAIGGMVTLTILGLLSLRSRLETTGLAPAIPPAPTAASSVPSASTSPNASPIEAAAEAAAPATSASTIANVNLDAGLARPRPRTRKPSTNCNPPFTLDPSGIHIPKPECL
jgi:serine/threonine protein kinase